MLGLNAFEKSKCLKGKKLIQSLFREGSSRCFHPLRVVYMPCTHLTDHQVLFAVPKKRVRHAVCRNRIKRRMREAYRLNKSLLRGGTQGGFLMGYIFIGSGNACTFKIIQERLIASLHHLRRFHAQTD